MIVIKKLVSIAIIIIALFTFPLAVTATETKVAVDNTVTGGEYETTHMEVTQWYSRVNNGVLEVRLWSVTYGYWKTDWIVVT